VTVDPRGCGPSNRTRAPTSTVWSSTAGRRWKRVRAIRPAARKYEFHFTCPEYIAPQDIRYRYRLEGLEADWSEPIAERKVSYSNLPSGSYRFRSRPATGT